MSRDFYNPLLLLLVVVLLSCRISHVGDAGSLEVWVMVICATGFVLDGALALARALTQRPSVMCVVWAMVFLLVGCSTWVMATANQGVETEDLDAYRTMYAQYREGADVNARNENGDTLLLLAVECGKENVVRTLLGNSDLTAEQLPQAAMRAIITNRVPELQMLLEHGANALLADETGVSPLSNAVISGNTRVVKLLREAGASPTAADPDGREPASYSRSEKMDAALQ